MAPGTIVIAVAGATVILLSVGGLMEISERAGPFEEALVPAAVPFQATGTYQASGPTGTRGPGGVCIPESAGAACSGPRLTVKLRLTGLPVLGPHAFYVGWLAGADDANALYLGAFTHDGDVHSLDHHEDRDARDHRRLLVKVEHERRPASPGSLQILELDVTDQGRNAPAELSLEVVATLASGEGHVRLAEIGAMAKSVVAIGEIRNVRHIAGWSYQGWFVATGPVPRYVAVDGFEWSTKDPGHGILDARVENMRVEDQARFLVTLEPTGVSLASVPGGFPAFDATLQP